MNGLRLIIINKEGKSNLQWIIQKFCQPLENFYLRPYLLSVNLILLRRMKYDYSTRSL